MDIKSHAKMLVEAAVDNYRMRFARFVPADRVEVTERAVRSVIGEAEDLEIERLTAGASGATVLKVSSHSKLWVLRLDSPSDGFRDPARQYACHAIAAQAQVAPQLFYCDANDRVSIAEFLVEDLMASREAKLSAIAASLKKLHATPQFPPFMPFLSAMSGLLDGFSSTRIAPPNVLENLQGMLRLIQEVYPTSNLDIVSSHNDLNPNNVIFARGQAYFVDWESAFSADRYVDMATTTIFFCATDEERYQLMAAYFGRDPLPNELARLELMRQVSRIYYGVMLLFAAARSDPNFSPPDDLFAQDRGLDAEPKGIATSESKTNLAGLLLRAALDTGRSDRFHSAIDFLR